VVGHSRTAALASNAARGQRAFTMANQRYAPKAITSMESYNVKATRSTIRARLTLFRKRLAAVRRAYRDEASDGSAARHITRGHGTARRFPEFIARSRPERVASAGARATHCRPRSRLGGKDRRFARISRRRTAHRFDGRDKVAIPPALFTIGRRLAASADDRDAETAR